jgi:hypothetical protein
VSDVLLQSDQPSTGRAQVAETSRLPRWFGVNLLVLGAALVGNALLGPLAAGVISRAGVTTMLAAMSSRRRMPPE